MGASAGVSFATSSGEYYTILSCDYAMRSAACAAAGPQATVVAGVAGAGAVEGAGPEFIEPGSDI